VPEAQVPLLPGELPADDQELRRRALEVFVEIIRRIAAARPLVAVVDDAQWATPPGARMLLEHFQGPNAPRGMMVFAHRSEDADTPLLRAAESWRGDLRRIDLPALPAVLPGGDDRPGS
jgi:hypothetical protein